MTAREVVDSVVTKLLQEGDGSYTTYDIFAAAMQHAAEFCRNGMIATECIIDPFDLGFNYGKERSARTLESLAKELDNG